MEFFELDETFVGAVKNKALDKGAVKQGGQYIIYTNAKTGVGTTIEDGKTGFQGWDNGGNFTAHTSSKVYFNAVNAMGAICKN